MLLGNGDGTFQTCVSYATGAYPASVAVNDLNRDGKQDLAVANASGTVSVLLGLGNGAFSTFVSYAAGTNPNSVSVGDFNGDSHLDLVVANVGSADVSVLLGNGNGTFQGRIDYAVGENPRSIAVGDLNNDGRPDLAVANNDGAGTVSILLGQTCNLPPVAKCRDVTVSAGPGRTANASIDDYSFDPDAGDTVTLSQFPPGPYPMGQTLVTLTAVDAQGTSSSCSATVTVLDSTPPTLVVPGDMVVVASDTSGAAVSYVVSATDAVDDEVTVSCTPPPGVFPVGCTTVHCTATDDYGNTATADFHVIVTLNAERAAGGWVSSDGGTLSSPDSSVTLIIPSGAKTEPFYLAIAEIGSAYELTSNLGQRGFAVFGVTIQPDGAQFNEPVTMIFRWLDTDNDGVVDGTHIQEESLLITKDNDAITERGLAYEGFDGVNNTITFTVMSLSEFALVFFDEAGPVTSAVMAVPFPVPVNTPVTLSAVLDDSTTGHSAIGGAEYAVDPNSSSDFQPMTAADGVTDGTREAMTASLPAFAQPGVHTVCVQGWDRYGNVIGNTESLFLPVYDPEGGFVTGGGWINSPVGAFHPDLEEYAGVTGKATFGFVAKYLKGANVPSGNTEFQFKAGNLNFKSTAYEWLVVAGASAKYKGAGTVNGVDGSGFMLTAIDGNLLGGGRSDRFRIKLWDVATGVVIYDNQAGTDENAELNDTTILQGGSIVIHKP
ncbi:MAG: FG-GAP-like repeat-containing protein [Verrucomicrobiia bacterium]